MGPKKFYRPASMDEDIDIRWNDQSLRVKADCVMGNRVDFSIRIIFNSYILRKWPRPEKDEGILHTVWSWPVRSALSRECSYGT